MPASGTRGGGLSPWLARGGGGRRRRERRPRM